MPQYDSVRWSETDLQLTVNYGVDTGVGNSKQEQASLNLWVDFAG